MDDVTRLLSTGKVVKIWDADSMTLLEQLDPHGGQHPLTQACWTADNQHLVSASSGGDKLVVSSLKSPHVSTAVLAEGKGQTRVSLSSSSQFLASGGLDRCVHIWDLRTSRPLRSLKDHAEEVTCVTFNANDSLLASGSADGQLVVHSLATNTSGKAFGHGGQQPVRDLAPSRTKRTLLGSVSEGGWLSLWDARTQKELHAFRGAHKAPGSGLAFSPVSELLLVSVGLDKKIVCYDAASKIVVRTIRAEAPLTSVEFTPDGSGVVAGSAQGHVVYYDLRNSAAPVRVTAAHDFAVTCLRFHNDRHKASKTSRTSDAKGSVSKASGGLSGSSPPSSDREKGAERFPAAAVGRNSLDVFSPLRRDAGGAPASADGTFAAAQATLPRQEAGPLKGRGSLDVFSPLREASLPRQEAGPLKTTGRGSLDVFSPLREGPTEAAAPPAVSRTPSAFHMSIVKEEEEPVPEARPPDKVEMTSPDKEAPGRGDRPAPPPIPEALTNGVPARRNDASPDAPFTSVQMNVITDIIHRSLDELRELVHQEVFHLQVEMIRQFCIQMEEFHAMMTAQKSAHDALTEENRRLREENLRLSSNY
ncbi:protein NEDD1 [Corythoichthys intestinalis]|uniref:protein NEDD1 n=1 Tax=Corythoichthys intestinalis TaxID=161448 RepID=UPI0025A63DC7|nr:protein NEDD1 [Corythoichthys intestinalis]XP_057691647.1 protein NEDD1 [Corythoichthys intestinalis]XP_061812396.1 protein NEDD1-like [Nerophis lumbriciformis]